MAGLLTALLSTDCMAHDQPPDAPALEVGALRAIDASLNRASEGVRVVEDYARFVLDDRFLTQLAKELRHELAAVGATIPLADRHASRDTTADVGTTISTTAEATRADAWEVCVASQERLQQALRSLEEFAKTIRPEAAARFEQLRYRSYTLGKAIGTVHRNSERLAETQLYVLIDGRPSLIEFEELVSSLCSAGADILQLRDKRLDDRQLVERAQSLVRMARPAGVLTIINDRPDIARLASADGVHVGQEELSVKEARTIVGPRALVGVSTHNLEQVREAVLDGADYLGLGPTFPTTTKTFDEFPGLDFLRAASQETKLPAFAIGGIGASNLPSVLKTGVTRIAVASAVTGAKEPETVVTRLKSLLTTKKKKNTNLR